MTDVAGVPPDTPDRSTPTTAPVADWTTDWDHHHPTWTTDPFPIWTDLRGRCPMAHTDRYNHGVWLPLTAEQIDVIAHDTDSFSNDHDGITVTGTAARVRFPPIHSDPPEHAGLRRAILPFFAPRRIDAWESPITEHSHTLARAIADRGRGDAAVDYAQHIPVHAIAAILGLDPADGDRFRRWIVDFIEIGGRDPEVRMAAMAWTGMCWA